MASCPPLDLLCVPGGPGQAALMEDEAVLEWIRQHARRGRLCYLTSVCTGALVLAATGLLQKGQSSPCQATTHWGFTSLLGELDVATPAAPQRVVVSAIDVDVEGPPEQEEEEQQQQQQQRRRRRRLTLITGGGVTAGVDFGLAVVAEIYGLATAQVRGGVLCSRRRPPRHATNRRLGAIPTTTDPPTDRPSSCRSSMIRTRRRAWRAAVGPTEPPPRCGPRWRPRPRRCWPGGGPSAGASGRG